MCLYPKLIKNRKYTLTKKNNGIIPKCKDERIKWVPIGCGKCKECMKQKSREWQIRLYEEVRSDESGKFITLTFSEESMSKIFNEIELKSKNETVDNAIAKLAVRRFLERWRKKFGKSVKHWLITELGHEGTERLHIHGILFTNVNNETIHQLWQYGYIWIGNYVNNATVNYIIKYVTKVDEQHKGYTPRILTSAGIGKGWLDKSDKRLNVYSGKETREYYRNQQGYKMALPKYYRNKIYSEEEREKLWINLIDKGVRWVNGLKVDATNEELYTRAVATARKINERLGYGNDEKEWQKDSYDEQRRKAGLLKKYKDRKKEELSKNNK